MLTVIITSLILLICFFVSLYIVGVKSEPYSVALRFIDNNKTILETIGSLESRRLAFFGYSVRYKGPRGHAEYKVLVKGRKSKGKVFLELEKSAGEWKVLKAKLKLNNKQIINLIE